MKMPLPPPAGESPDAESEMSFPASDPPSHNQPTLGDGDHETDEEEPTRRVPSGAPTAEGREEETAGADQPADSAD